MKTFLLLFLPLITHGQIIYKGNVVNKTTKEKIPFATVGLIKENKGVNADEEGRFSITSKNQGNDTLVISCIGYETSKFPVDNLPANLQFEIPGKQIALKAVIVNSNLNITATLNDFSNCGINSYTTSGSVTQVAQHLRSPIANSLLSEINICKTWDDCMFRIRVYDMDSISGKPSSDLADTIIEVKSGKRHVHLDLEQYKIIIPGKDFFVAVEWLYIPYNENRVKTNMDGIKRTHIQYGPNIFFKKNEHALQSWQLDYRGKWLKVLPDWTMLISAKIKY